MKKIILLISMILFLNFSFAYHDLVEKDINGKKVKLIRVLLDKNTKLKTSIVKNGDKAKSLKTLVKKENGTTGINGAFFCPDEEKYNWCKRGTSSSVRIYNGNFYSKYGKDTGAKGIFGTTKDNKAIFAQNNLGYVPGYSNNTNQDKINKIKYGIGMVILVDDGKAVSQKSKLVNDKKHSNKGPRNFICNTSSNIVYLGKVYNITLANLGKYLKNNIGCQNAIMLDNGASSSIFYKGNYIDNPGRNIRDAFIITDKNTKTNLKSSTKSQIENILSGFFNKIEKTSSNKKSISKYYNIIQKINKQKSHKILSYVKEILAKRIFKLN